VGWFSLTEPGQVDEIRIVVGGGEPFRQWQVAKRRLALKWVAEPAPPKTAAVN
jgi:uridylate kinase